MAKKITVIGTGHIGSFVSHYLKKQNYDLRLVDLYKNNVQPLAKKLDCEWSVADVLSITNLKKAISGVDLVITAVPASIGYHVVKNIANQGLNIVDLSSFPEDPLKIKYIAEKKDITVILDAGIAPGLTNLLVGAAKEMLGGLTEIRIYVGRITETYDSPIGIGAGFSTSDYIEEYRRPARYINRGIIEYCYPLDCLQGKKYSEEIGELEYLPTDGLRSLLKTYPNLKFAGAYNLCWPGHIEFMRGLKKIGLLDHVKINDKIYVDECVAQAISSSKTNIKDVVVLIVEAYYGKKGVIFNQMIKNQEPWTAIARATGSFIAFTVEEFLNGNINVKGLLFPENMTDNSIKILEKFAKYEMPVKESFIVRK